MFNDKRLNIAIFIGACGVLPCSIDPNHSLWTLFGGYSAGIIITALLYYLNSGKSFSSIDDDRR